MKEEEEKYERSIQCAERYQAWVENKGKPRRGPPPPTLTQRYIVPVPLPTKRNKQVVLLTVFTTLNLD